jgi:hypothetical protein
VDLRTSQARLRPRERLLERFGGARDLARDVLLVLDAELLRRERRGERADEPEWCAQRLVNLANRRPCPRARVLFPENVRHVVRVIDRSHQN